MTIFDGKHFKITEQLTVQKRKSGGLPFKHSYYQYFNCYLPHS